MSLGGGGGSGVDFGSGVLGPLGVLAGGVEGLDGHGHGLPQIRALPRGDGHGGEGGRGEDGAGDGGVEVGRRGPQSMIMRSVPPG